MLRTLTKRNEDQAAVTGDVGAPVLGVRNDNLQTAHAGSNGDYGNIQQDVFGDIWIDQATKTAQLAEGSATVEDINGVAPDYYGIVDSLGQEVKAFFIYNGTQGTVLCSDDDTNVNFCIAVPASKSIFISLADNKLLGFRRLGVKAADGGDLRNGTVYASTFRGV